MNAEQDDKDTAFFFQLKHLPPQQQVAMVKQYLAKNPHVATTRRFVEWGTAIAGEL